MFSEIVAWLASGVTIANINLGVLPGVTNCNFPERTRPAGSGIWVRGAEDVPNFVGSYIYGNVIGCHVGGGILIDHADEVYIGYQEDKVTANANWIGVSPTGAIIPNGRQGIYTLGYGDGDHYDKIGNNTIAYNGMAGITVEGEDAEGVFIHNNLIYSNGGLPIDLGADGFTPNDLYDYDTEPNYLLN